jgi:hypothetical protein
VTPAPLPADLTDGLQPASRGVGPLIQRDYWAVIRDCRLSPSELITFLRERFVDFPPADLLRFGKNTSPEQALQVGDELDIDMGFAGWAAVRVLALDEQSLTLGTLEGHPEAGRITFGAYRNGRGDVIFHIRSRARSSSLVRYIGFLIIGDPMQTNTWTDFIDRTAHTVGEGVIGAIHADAQTVDGDDGPDVMISPTFIAAGD